MATTGMKKKAEIKFDCAIFIGHIYVLMIRIYIKISTSTFSKPLALGQVGGGGLLVACSSNRDALITNQGACRGTLICIYSLASVDEPQPNT